jgi:glutaredoxin
MKTSSVAVLALALACGPLAAAQLYRWVDEKGNVEYRDTPPPANAKKVERRDMTANTIETSALPYSVQQAVKNHPVTLWSFDCGDPCTKARAHLARRGVPHTERSPQKEPDAMKQATGALDVPVLIVGKNQLKGYLDEAWDSALDSAGYPRTAPAGTRQQVQSTAKGTPDAPPSKAAPGAAKPPAETAAKASAK